LPTVRYIIFLVWSRILLSVTQEHDFDRSSGFAGRNQTIRRLWPLTDVFQLTVRCVEVPSVLVGAS